MSDPLSRTFSALADPTRRRLLAHLSKGEASVNELAAPLLKEMTLPAVTKHLKVLERAGLLKKSKDAQYRPCTINAKPMREALHWIEHYRAFWEEAFDRLDAHLEVMKMNLEQSTKNGSLQNLTGRNPLTKTPTLRKATTSKKGRSAKRKTKADRRIKSTSK